MVTIKQVRALVFKAQDMGVALPRPFPSMANGYDWGDIIVTDQDRDEGRAELDGDVKPQTLENWARFAAVRRHFPRIDRGVIDKALSARAAHTFASYLRSAGVPVAGFETEVVAAPSRPMAAAPAAAPRGSNVEAGLFKLLMAGTVTREEIETFMRVSEALKAV